MGISVLITTCTSLAVQTVSPWSGPFWARPDSLHLKAPGKHRPDCNLGPNRARATRPRCRRRGPPTRWQKPHSTICPLPSIGCRSETADWLHQMVTKLSRCALEVKGSHVFPGSSRPETGAEVEDDECRVEPMRARGLEPPRALAHRVLNPARLQVQPHRQEIRGSRRR